MKKVTIVTVCYNAEAHIENTIRSVLSQKFEDFEYIVIDGNSTDSTLTVINIFLDKIDYFLSEPDNGIYDAMNKAIDLATGEWIIFMNSNDWFVDNNVLSDVFLKDHSDTDFLYGDHQFVKGEKVFHVKARPLSTMWQRIAFSHQALFSRTSLMKNNKFDLSKQVVADYDFYYQSYAKGHKFKYLNREVAAVSDGGFSSISFARRTMERWRVVRANTPSLKVNTYYFILLLWGVLPAKIKIYLRNQIKPLRALP